jgi:hypothetical protein
MAVFRGCAGKHHFSRHAAERFSRFICLSETYAVAAEERLVGSDGLRVVSRAAEVSAEWLDIST